MISEGLAKESAANQIWIYFLSRDEELIQYCCYIKLTGRKLRKKFKYLRNRLRISWEECIFLK